MKNRILLITSIYPPQVGGPAVFTSRFSKWLTHRNFEVQVITYSNLNDKKNNVISIKIRPNRVLSFYKFIVGIIKNSDSHTLILCNGAFIETYFACLITNRKYVAKIPGDPVWEISRNKKWTLKNIEDFQSIKINSLAQILRKFFNLAFKKAKYIISPSHQLSNFVRNWGVEPSRVKTVYNCVNPNKFKNLNMNFKTYDLVTVCRLVPWKGLEELIDVANLLNLKLAIVGNGPLRRNLELQSQNSGSKIKFFGDVSNENVVEILNQSRIFVLNSEFEATSYAIIEAKMCGLPVVARKTDGSATLVKNGMDGVVYSPELNQSLRNSVLKLIQNDQLLQTYGIAARKDALERFNQEINFKEILDLMMKSS